MKNNKQKSLVKSARKQAITDIKLRLVTDLNEVTGKIGEGSKKLAKEIKKGSKKLAKKVVSELKFEVAAASEKVKSEKTPKAEKAPKADKADKVEKTAAPKKDTAKAPALVTPKPAAKVVAAKTKAAAAAKKPNAEPAASDAADGRTLPD